MLGMFDRCPRQYFYRYCEGLVLPPAVAMIVGTGVHVSSAKDLTAKRDTGDLLPLKAVTEAAFDAVNGEWDKTGVMLDDEERLLGEKRVRGEAVDASVALAKLHHKELAPTIRPKHIERGFSVPLKNHPFDLGGTIDLQEDDGTLHDLKTRAASPPAGLADTSLDLSFYGLAAWSLDGTPPPKLALDCLVKTKTPKIVTLVTTRTKAAYNALLLRVELVNRAIESGVFPPCSPDSWCCSAKFCGYFGRCPFGAAARVMG
jgi:putative RecB family exonuclease